MYFGYLMRHHRLVYDMNSVELLRKGEDVHPDGYINLARLRQWNVDGRGEPFKCDTAETLYLLSPIYFFRSNGG